MNCMYLRIRTKDYKKYIYIAIIQNVRKKLTLKFVKHVNIKNLSK